MKKYETHAGDSFHTVAELAKEEAKRSKDLVFFDFNEIKCIVGPMTDLALLWRDYSYAHLMEWKEIGPHFDATYKAEVQQELDKRTAASEERQRKQQEEFRRKDDKERAEYEAKTVGVEIELSNKELWADVRQKNSDPYGKCCIDYAESWAKLMQVEIKAGKTVAQCAKKTSYELGFYGITGFMYGAAVHTLSACWIHGEELRKWHNKDYGHEGEGVVNPAILTVSTD